MVGSMEESFQLVLEEVVVVERLMPSNLKKSYLEPDPMY